MEYKYSPKIEKPHDINTDVVDAEVLRPNPTKHKNKPVFIPSKPKINFDKSVSISNHKDRAPVQEIINTSSTTTNHNKKDEKYKKSSLLKTVAIIFITMILSLIVIYIVVNFDALSARATFQENDSDVIEYSNDQKTAKVAVFYKNDDGLLFLPIIIEYPDPKVVEFPEEKKDEVVTEEAPQEENFSTSDESTYVAQNTLNNQLSVPSLGIQCPIVWDSSVDENSMLASLQNGVAHYLGTAKPGEGLENNTGNVFISGHSSYYSWDPGQYHSIFATLPYINVGDKVVIGYNDKVYVYEVYDKTEVAPENVDVVKQDTSEHIVTLMTCVPVGTSERRLIVRARFVGYAE